MKLFFPAIVFAFVSALGAPFAFGATVFGNVYDSSFELAENVLVSINSTPVQKELSKDGGFSFEVEKGKAYELSVSDPKTSGLLLKEGFFVESDGIFEYDLILFLDPQIDEELNASNNDEPVDAIIPDNPVFFDPLFLAVSALLLAIFAFFAFKHLSLRQGRQKQEKQTQRALVLSQLPGLQNEALKESEGKNGKEKGGTVSLNEKSKTMLTAEAREVLKLVIGEFGGLASQKDLRDKLPYSEARVSLLVSELEDAGLVKRIKRGRGNIVKKI